MIHKKASIKIGNYLKNAVGNAKIFVTNRFTSMLPTGGGNLISSFVDIGLNKVSNSQAKVAAQILKKSPFEIPDSPEQAIKSDPMAFSHIQYPADLTGDELGHYMLFFTLNNNMDWDLASVQQDLQFSADLGIDTGLTASNSWSLGGNTTGKRWREGGGSIAENQNRFRTGSSAGRIDQVKLENSVTSAVPKNQIVTSAIALYMPPEVKASYKAGWGEEDTEFSGDIANITKNVLNAKDWSEIGISIGTGGVGALSAYIKKIGGNLTEALGGGDPFKLVSKILGIAVNPRQEMYYQGPSFREFDYEFKFWPRNEDETNRVQNIIKLFKYHMHPAMDVLSGGRNFRIPSEFEIHYLCRTGINDKLNRISRCALQSCNVSYSPEGGNFKTFEDNAPVAYTMSLSFKELEFMTKSTIAKGM